MTLAAGSKLGPYEIASLLGEGGMGEVYRARDSRLARDVAIKVLPSSTSTDPGRLLRFEREARAASALNHPNILTIHDIGTQDGAPYIVSELLEGATLREQLGSPLTPRKAIDIALQIASGLAAAHAKGIVHRDLKPENLFVTSDNRVKILDFGIAKLTEREGGDDLAMDAPTVPAPTETGIVMGTIGYMSPEQLRGLPVDHRSDIFSFGAILYEMLSGRKAFKRDSPVDTMSAILNEEPPELTESGRGVSPALDRIVRHCLEKDRDNRFQTAKDVAFALSEQSAPTLTSKSITPRTGRKKLLIAAVAIVALAVAGFFLFKRPQKTLGETTGVKRVAVLPFENLGSPEDEYFADGMADEVRGKLTTLPGLQVIARATSMSYKKAAKTPRQIADELGVSYLLSAAVRWQKSKGTSRVHVSAELVEVSGAAPPISKWQQPFDAQLTDVFQVQSDIASRVAQALGVALDASEVKRLAEKPTQNLAAYDAFLKGEGAADSLQVNDPHRLRNALGFYEQAVALEPGFAQAWAKVSFVSTLLYNLSIPTPELAERARQAAEKAVVLAAERPEGYLALGAYRLLVVPDFSRALEDCAQGRRFAPANADLLRVTGLAERALGRWDAAVGHLRQAERLDPRSARNSMHLGAALCRLRRYPEAREALDRGLAFAPANHALIEYKAMTFLGEGDLAGARAVLKAAPREAEPMALVAFVAEHFDLVWLLDEPQRELLLRLTPTAFDDDRGGWGLYLAQASALKGDGASVRTYAAEAKKSIAEQLRRAPEDAGLHAKLGLALAYLGQKPDAVREGERAVALQPVAKDAYGGPEFQRQLVMIYILVAEPEKALDRLGPLLKIPDLLSPGWLKIDPNFDPLRNNPRFQKLVASAN